MLPLASIAAACGAEGRMGGTERREPAKFVCSLDEVVVGVGGGVVVVGGGVVVDDSKESSSKEEKPKAET